MDQTEKADRAQIAAQEMLRSYLATTAAAVTQAAEPIQTTEITEPTEPTQLKQGSAHSELARESEANARALERSQRRSGPTEARLDLIPLDAAAEFPWTPSSSAAAHALAGLTLPPGQLSPLRVAAACGCTAREVRQWQCHPGFRDRVRNLAQASADFLSADGMAAKATRIEALKNRHALLTEIIERRQEHWTTEAPDDFVEDRSVSNGGAHVPGLQTGLMLLTKKRIGGDLGETVLESQTDTALLKELRAIEQHISQELGQWAPATATQVNVKLYGGINLEAV